MRPFARVAVLLALGHAASIGGACSSVTETGTRRGYPGSSGSSDAGVVAPEADGTPRSVEPIPARDAEILRPRDRRAADAGPMAARDGSPGALHDASPAASDAVADGVAPGIQDASRDDAAPAAPDCSCPDLGFFLDATMGASSLHLTAPYLLRIYCNETTVQLGHPPCSGVYRLSACDGPNNAPPCMYMAVDRSRGFLLGSFVDADGAPWDILGGDIVPDPPSGRVETGTFSATLRPRAGGDAATLSGSFRACVTLGLSCAG
jgi:hypothetical protein